MSDQAQKPTEHEEAVKREARELVERKDWEALDWLVRREELRAQLEHPVGDEPTTTGS